MNIEGKRVDLRAIDSSIVHHLFEWHLDPEFDKSMMVESGPKSEIDIKVMYDRFLPPHGRFFAISEHGKLVPIGFIVLHNLDMVNRKAEIIAGLGTMRGEGLMAEAVTLMMDWGISQLGLQRIYANVVAGNERCMKMLSACGFKKEAEFKNEIYRNGAYVNRIVFGYNLVSTLPLEMFKKVTEFVKHYKETTKKNIHGGHVDMLNSFCEFVRKTGGDD